MALINPSSTDLIPESLNLHSTLPTQVACEKSRIQIYHPKNPIEKDGPISFKVVSGDNDCIDPYNTYLYTKIAILSATGEIIPRRLPGPPAAANPARNVLFVNGIGSAWIQICEVKLNNKRISANDNNYAHRADLENRLSYTTSVKDNSLKLSGFISEKLPIDAIGADALHLDDDEGEVAADDALRERYMSSVGGKHLSVIARVHTEICEQPKLLPPNTVLDFTFHPNESPFMLLTKRDERYRHKILDCKLFVNHVKINPTIARELEEITSRGERMKYPVRRVEVTYYTKSVGMSDLSQPGAIQGKKPRRLFFGVLDLEAFHGSYKKDPFNYKHFSAKEVSIRVDGERYPDEAMKMNYADGDVLIPLLSLLRTTDSFLSDKDIGIGRDTFASRNAIYAFDLTSTGAAGGENFELSNNATIDIQILLNGPLTAAAAVVMYAEYDAEILIDQDRMIEYHE